MWRIRTSPGRVEIARAPAGRAVDALASFLFGAAIGGLGGALFFGIDWVGRSATGVDVPPGYLLAIAVLAVLVGFAFAFVTLLRDKTWIVDDEAGTLGLRRRFANPELVEVPLEELRGFRVTRTTVAAVFADGSEDIIARSRLFVRAVAQVAEAVTRAVPEKAVSENK